MHASKIWCDRKSCKIFRILKELNTTGVQWMNESLISWLVVQSISNYSRRRNKSQFQYNEMNERMNESSLLALAIKAVSRLIRQGTHDTGDICGPGLGCVSCICSASIGERHRSPAHSDQFAGLWATAGPWDYYEKADDEAPSEVQVVSSPEYRLS
jgi:hypothetical protein